MNMKELAARYAQLADANPMVYVWEALKACSIYIEDNATPEQALEELEIAYLLTRRQMRCAEANGHSRGLGMLKRQATIYKRAIAQVKRCKA